MRLRQAPHLGRGRREKSGFNSYFLSGTIYICTVDSGLRVRWAIKCILHRALKCTKSAMQSTSYEVHSSHLRSVNKKILNEYIIMVMIITTPDVNMRMCFNVESRANKEPVCAFNVYMS
jgi:hypothetical protein